MLKVQKTGSAFCSPGVLNVLVCLLLLDVTSSFIVTTSDGLQPSSFLVLVRCLLDSMWRRCQALEQFKALAIAWGQAAR